MEPNRASKRPLGTRTCSQSQIQLHRTRSGLVINRFLSTSESDRKRPRSTQSSDPNSLIKDLRVKRVFSQTYNPPTTPINETKSGTVFFSAQPDGNSPEVKIDRVEICGNEIDCSAPDLDDSKSKEPEILGLRFLAQSPNSAEQMGSGSGFDPPEAKANGVELKIDNETKMVLKSRKRVFKAPGSFSYRRMLPYLKDITKDNSCVLDFCELPNRGKGLEGKSFQNKLISDNQEACVHQFTKQNFSLESGNIDVSTLETVQGHLSSESPQCVPSSPSMVVFDQCLPMPPVDGQNEKIDLRSSCEVLQLNVSEPSSMEDSQVTADGVMVMCTGDVTPGKNMGTAVTDVMVSVSKDQNVKDINFQSSSIVDERYSCKDSEVFEHKEKSSQAQYGGIREIDMGYPRTVRTPNHTNEQRVGNAEEVLSQICDLNEESIQMTPPDAEILDKLQVDVKVIGGAGYVHHSTDHGLGNPSSGINNRDQCSPTRKPVLNPCTRLKLFRSPGSISYRRLLPFLMEMEKSTSVSSPCESTFKDKSNGLLFNAEPGTPTPQLTNVNGSFNIDGPNLTSPEHITGSQVPSDVEKEMHGQLFQSPSEKDSVRTYCPELPVTSVLPLGTFKDCISSNTVLTDGGKPAEAGSLGHDSSEIGATISSITQPGAVRKGILKRNPRGCRGLCTCLNCASFRLHAERAFEFSRNQMQDAEEVALNLMAELSRLRMLLGKSAAPANDHVVNSKEVKSACRKASEAEDLARNRLVELNYDLNIHCRVTCVHEPSVRFANHFEEKVVPKARRSSD